MALPSPYKVGSPSSDDTFTGDPSRKVGENTGAAINAYRIPLNSFPAPNPSPDDPMTFLLVWENEKLLPSFIILFPMFQLNRN